MRVTLNGIRVLLHAHANKNKVTMNTKVRINDNRNHSLRKIFEIVYKNYLWIFFESSNKYYSFVEMFLYKTKHHRVTSRHIIWMKTVLSANAFVKKADMLWSH